MKQNFTIYVIFSILILSLIYLQHENFLFKYNSFFNKYKILDVSLNDSLIENKVKNNETCALILDKILNEYKDVQSNKSHEETQILSVLNRNKIENTFIVTVSNSGFRDLTLNWILSLKRINITKFVIFSFDEEFVDYLISKGYKDNVLNLPKSWLHLSVDKTPANFLTKNYYAITQAKTNVVYKLLTLNQKFIFSDVDIVWLNKAIFSYADMIIKSSNAHMIYAQDFGIKQPYFNTGFFLATPTDFTKRLYFMLTKLQEQDAKSVDQFVLDKILKKISFNDNRLETFDLMTIANGYYFFHKRMDELYNITPFAVHANYFPSLQTKVNALKSRNLWFI